MRFNSAMIFTVLAALVSPCFAAEPTDVPAVKTSGRKPDADFLKLHEQFLDRGKKGPIGILLLGDSITAGWFWGNNKEIYDAHFGKHDPANFGIGGDRTEHVLWRIANGELDHIHPKLIVLLIGTNNIGSPAADITRGVTAVIDQVRAKLPRSKLLVLAIFPRGADPKNPGTEAMREKIEAVNAQLTKLDDGHSVRFLDIGHIFLSPDGSISKDIMPDALHPNHHGYEIWADAMQPTIDQMLGR